MTDPSGTNGDPNSAGGDPRPSLDGELYTYHSRFLLLSRLKSWLFRIIPVFIFAVAGLSVLDLVSMLIADGSPIIPYQGTLQTIGFIITGVFLLFDATVYTGVHHYREKSKAVFDESVQTELPKMARLRVRLIVILFLSGLFTVGYGVLMHVSGF